MNLSTRRCLAFFLLLFVLTGQAQAALDVFVSMNPDTARPGELVRVDVTVTNTGASAETSAVLEASVPAEFSTFFNGGATTGGATCTNGTCSAGEVVTWSLGTFAPGQSTTVSYWTDVLSGGSAPADGTVITVDADLTYDVAQATSASQSVTADADNPLAIEIDQDLDPVRSGDTMVYTVSYGNRGINSVTGNSLSVPLPAGVTFVSASGGGSLNAGAVEWNLGTLVAGQSGRQQIVVTVDTLSAGTLLIVDAASISGTDTGTASAVTSRAITSARVTAASGIAMTVAVNPDPVRSGELAHNAITVANQAGETLFNVELQMRVPPEFSTFFNGSQTTGGATCSNGTCSAKELVTWNLGTLPPGRSVTVTAWTNMQTLDGGRLAAVEAIVTADGGRQTLATYTAAVDNDTALTLSLNEDLNPVRSGDTLVYTLNYGNRSVNTVQSNTLRLPLPGGVTFASATGGGTLNGNTVEWNLGTIVAGQSDRQQVTVTVDSLTAGTLLPVDAATITGTNTANFLVEQYRAASTIRVVGAAGIGMTVAVNPDPARSGELTHSAITVANQAGETLFNVTVEMRMPPEFTTFFNNGESTGGATCSNGTCSANEIVTWNLGILPPGGSVTLTAWTDLASVDAGRLAVVDAIVTADGGRQTLASHTAAVDNDTALMLSLDQSLDPVRTADTLVYTLNYGNRSVSSVQSNTLRLPLPVGVTFVSASGGGALNGDTVEWNLGTLVAGQSGRQQVSVTVNAAAGGTTLPIDAATITGTNLANFLVEEYRAAVTNRIVAAAGIGMTVAVNPDPVRSGELSSSNITVSNQAGETLFNVTLLMRVPPEFATFFNASRTTGGGTCSNGTCSANELVTWNLGTLPPGNSVSVAAWANMQSVDAGRISVVDAIVTADGGRQTLASHTAAIDNDTALALSIDVSEDVVLPGDSVTYTLTFGNRSISTVTGTTLTFPVPAAATTVNSSGGTISNGVISWNLGSLAAGTGGRRTVTATLAGIAGDQAVVDAAELAATSSSVEQLRATQAVRLENARPLDLTIEYVVNPTQPDDTMTALIEVTNSSGSSVADVVLLARVPSGLDTFFSSTNVTGGGTCTNGTCSAGELVTWNLGTLAASDTVSVSYTTDVTGGASAPADGEIIRLDVEARDSSTTDVVASDSALVGVFTGDSDGDGVANLFDNCINDPNSNQRDTNGDGFGNLCDADFNGNGVVDPFDFSLLKSRFGQTGFPDQDLNGNGLVDPFDFSKLKSNFGQAPGPSG
ncbi:MAG: hypothetical protein ACR2QV_13755, partial [Gammaproteobacteria bacterium]